MLKEDAPLIIFDNSSKEEILDSLGFKEKDGELIDDEGLIQTNDQIEIVKSKEFGGVLRGSKRVIKKDSSELARYFSEMI